MAPEVPYTFKMLERLKKLKKQIYLSSATPLAYLPKILELRRISRLFDGVYGAPPSKIDHINQILSITKSKLDKIVYIGDSEIDRITAMKSGCGFIGIDNGDNRFNQKPNMLIIDYKNLLNDITV